MINEPTQKSEDRSASILQRLVIPLLSYSDWCKKEELPKDNISRQIYQNWKSQRPQVQRIIDNLVTSRYHESLAELKELVKRMDQYDAV